MGLEWFAGRAFAPQRPHHHHWVCLRAPTGPGNEACLRALRWDQVCLRALVRGVPVTPRQHHRWVRLQALVTRCAYRPWYEACLRALVGCAFRPSRQVCLWALVRGVPVGSRQHHRWVRLRALVTRCAYGPWYEACLGPRQH